MIWLLLGVMAAVVTADLVTKFTIPGILNPGISWGFGAQWPWLWLVVVALSLAVVTLAVIWYVKTPRHSVLLTIGLALFLGGVIGNAVDRLFTGGAVHDFIDFVIFKNNLADIAITVGAVLVGVKLAFR